MPLIQVSEIKVPTAIHIYCPCVRDILYIPKAEILSHHWSAWPVLTILWLRDQLDDTLQFYNWADEFNMHSKYAFNMHSEHIGTTPLPKTSMGCLREGVAQTVNLYICSADRAVVWTNCSPHDYRKLILWCDAQDVSTMNLWTQSIPSDFKSIPWTVPYTELQKRKALSH